MHGLIFIVSTFVALYIKLTKRFTVDEEGMLQTIPALGIVNGRDSEERKGERERQMG